MGEDAATVLVLEPDAADGERLAALVRKSGAAAIVCSCGSEALRLLNSEPAQTVIMDLDLPDMPGLDLLAGLEERWPGMPVIVVAEGASVANALAALKAGAADFVEKPFDAEQISYVLAKAQATVKNQVARPPPPSSSAKAGMFGQSAAMRQAYQTIERAAHGTATVLIRGESGTGKELVARAIHDGSPRSHQPFVKIDCAALPENLLDSELFGYEKGAFTGAASRKPGRVELADKGTLFLDEIGELGLPLQGKLLRLLQDRQFERLGGTKTISVDVRVLAATHRDLDTMIERELFRHDLFYRLNVIPLWVPPLRARRDDIELLANHFCRTFGQANGRPEITIDAAALRLLRSHRWPGNVRQLQNFIERLIVLTVDPIIGEEQVRTELARRITFQTQPGTSETLAKASSSVPPRSPTASDEPDAVVLPLGAEMKIAEKKALERALKFAKGNRSLAARLLDLSRSTLYAKLQEHGLL